MDNTREKLIELIVQGNIMAFGKSESFAEIIADHLIANGVTLDNQVASSKWIPVTERLPDEDDDVLCCRGNHIGALIDVYTYKGDGKWEDSYGYWNYTDIEGITHWMPLPQPPKGE